MQILRVCNRKRVNFSKYKGCNHLSMFWVNFTIVIFSDICLPKFDKTQSNGKLQARTNPVMKKNQEKNPNTNVGVSYCIWSSHKNEKTTTWYVDYVSWNQFYHRKYCLLFAFRYMGELCYHPFMFITFMFGGYINHHSFWIIININPNLLAM